MGFTIKVLSHGQTIEAKKKDILSEKLRQAGIPLNLYCNRRGLCGKCFVEIVSGQRPDPRDREKYWLERGPLSARHRLACQYEVAGDLVVNVPVSSTQADVPILPQIPHSEITPNPVVKKYYLEFLKAEISILFRFRAGSWRVRPSPEDPRDILKIPAARSKRPGKR
jgi:uncharacterized 2Fe-2S/4Fe-4S cluster protein (DUF4445 family)